MKKLDKSNDHQLVARKLILSTLLTVLNYFPMTFKPLVSTRNAGKSDLFNLADHFIGVHMNKQNDIVDLCVRILAVDYKIREKTRTAFNYQLERVFLNLNFLLECCQPRAFH